MRPGTVVPEIVTLGQQEFHSRLVAGWSRAIVHVGRGAFADAIEMTTKGLAKVLGEDTTPHARTILNSRKAHPTALDELLAGYRVRLVPETAACSSDEGAGLSLLRAATKCVEAEADGVKHHHELLAMEPELRDAAAILAAMLTRIDRLKGTGRT